MIKRQKPEISCVSTYDDRRQLRTLLEFMFSTSNISAKLYKPRTKRKNTNDQKEKQGKYESIIVKINETTSYADMVKSVKEEVNPNMAMKVKTMKKTKNDDLLIVMEKGGAEELRNEISSKITGTEVSLGGRRKAIHILDMDITTNQDDIREASAKKLPYCNKNLIEVKILRSTSGECQIATVSMLANVADTLVSLGKVKVGWNVSQVRGRKNIPQSYNQKLRPT